VTFGCVTDSPGVSHLHVVPAQLGASYISQHGNHVVANVMLDEYLEARAVSRINLLKIDVEGLEPKVLRGALAPGIGAVDAVYVEVSCDNLARQGFARTMCFNRSGRRFRAAVRQGDRSPTASPSGADGSIVVRGRQLRACPISVFPSGHQTDILAVHRERLAEWQTR